MNGQQSEVPMFKLVLVGDGGTGKVCNSTEGIQGCCCVSFVTAKALVAIVI